MAPVSIPAASALQLSFGLKEKVGKGKLLGGGEMVNTTEPENMSSSTPLAEFKLLALLIQLLPFLLLHTLPGGDEIKGKTFLTSFANSRGSGPKGVVVVELKTLTQFEDFLGEFLSSFLGLLVGDFDFLGVRERSLVLLPLLGFLLAGAKESPRPPVLRW